MIGHCSRFLNNNGPILNLIIKFISLSDMVIKLWKYQFHWSTLSYYNKNQVKRLKYSIYSGLHFYRIIHFNFSDFHIETLTSLRVCQKSERLNIEV